MKAKTLAALRELPSIVKNKILLIALIGVAVTLLFAILWIKNLFTNGLNAPLLVPVLVGVAIVLKAYYDLIDAYQNGYLKIYGYSASDIGLDYALGGKKKGKLRTFTLIPEYAELIREGIAEEAEELTTPIVVPITSFFPSKNDDIILYLPKKSSAYKDFKGNTRYEKIYGYLLEEELNQDDNEEN